MADKRKILIQLDSDAQPSVFDRVVAIDAGADEVFSYGGVQPEQVRELVHGAIFTRGPKDLKSTALFIGGSDVAAGERLRAAARHLELRAAKALVLGGTGPVGQRVALLLARQGAEVRLSSRQQARAAGVVEAIRAKVADARLEPVGVAS